jgi:uncharacterized membrane protein
MESRAKILGHAGHAILIVFPLGLLSTAVIFDVIYLFTGNPNLSLVSFWMIISGIIGGLLAAVFGWIDWFAIPKNTRAKNIGLVHGVGNVAVMGLFAISWFARSRSDTLEPSATALIFSFLGAAIALFTAWLGGELVERLGVGVDRGAHLNAPNSLSKRPATESADD